MLFDMIARLFKDKKYMICFGTLCVILLVVTSPIIFTIPILIPVPIIAAFILAFAARAIWGAIASGVTVITSGSRVKKLAEEMPQYAEFEKRRSMLVGLRFVFFIVAILVIVVGAVIAYRYGDLTAAAIVAGVVLVLTLIAYLTIIKSRENRLRDEFKQLAVLEGLCWAFTNVKYEPKGLIKWQEIESLRLFKSFDSMSGNDYFEAERGGISFCRNDLNLSIEHRSDDGDGGTVTTYEKVFGGSIFRFDTGENYDVRLQAATVGFPHIRGAGGLGKLMGRSADRKVETEMVEFNRMFNVYCEDQTTARVILTPQMIESLNRFGRWIKHPVAFVFLGQYMYMVISTPRIDSFEVCLSKDSSVRDQQRMIMGQVSFIAGIVDNLYFKNRPVAYEGAPAGPADPALDTTLHVPAAHGTIQVVGVPQEQPQVFWLPEGVELPQGYGTTQGYDVGSDASGTPLGSQGYAAAQGYATPQGNEASQGRIAPGAYGRAQKRHNAFFRFIIRYPRSLCLMFFIVTCLIALFAAPNGMAIAFQDSDTIHVIPYMLIGGAFMAAFSFAGGQRGRGAATSWACAIVLTLIHLLVFFNSF